MAWGSAAATAMASAARADGATPPIAKQGRAAESGAKPDWESADSTRDDAPGSAAAAAEDLDWEKSAAAALSVALALSDGVGVEVEKVTDQSSKPAEAARPCASESAAAVDAAAAGAAAAAAAAEDDDEGPITVAGAVAGAKAADDGACILTSTLTSASAAAAMAACQARYRASARRCNRHAASAHSSGRASRGLCAAAAAGDDDAENASVDVVEFEAEAESGEACVTAPARMAVLAATSYPASRVTITTPAPASAPSKPSGARSVARSVGCQGSAAVAPSPS